MPLLAIGLAALASVFFVAAHLMLAAIGSRDLPSSLSNALAMLTYAAVGAVIALKRPRNAVGWLFLALGAAWQTYLVSGAYANVVLHRAGSLDAIAHLIWLPMNLWAAALGLIPLIVLLFPDGRPLTPRWRPAVWTAAAFAAMSVLVGGTTVGNVNILSPLALSAGERPDEPGLLSQASFLLFVCLVLAAAVSAVIRYRRARGEQRQQLKWLGSSAAFVVAVVVALELVPPLRALDPGARLPVEFLGGIPSALAFASVPLAAGVAILRYRLYDIDVLINRTLVYGATSAVVLAAYATSVVALQALLAPLTAGSQLAVAGSTLAAVAVVQPLRWRIQNAVDRRFYRSRYDAQRTLERFGTRLRDELDLDALSSELTSVVRETVQPAHASLWLRSR